MMLSSDCGAISDSSVDSTIKGWKLYDVYFLTAQDDDFIWKTKIAMAPV